MNMVIANEMLILFLDKKGDYGIRRNAQFLPKSAVVVAVYTKIDGEVSAIAYEPHGFGTVNAFNARVPKHRARSAAKGFGALLEQAVDPTVIISLLNDEPCHIDDVGERGQKLAQIIRELNSGPRASSAAIRRKG
jgi:hypothetical protein